MEFQQKYTTTAIAEKDKIQLSSDAYAVGEMLSELKTAMRELARVMRAK